jgi:hypothetical protein
MVSRPHLRMAGNHPARKRLVGSQKVPRLFEGSLDRRSRAFDPHLGVARHSLDGGWTGAFLPFDHLPRILAGRRTSLMRSSGLVGLCAAAGRFSER